MQYKITGAPLPVLTCNLNAGESMICQSGAMCWMDKNITMQTTTNGGIGKIFSRSFSGESMFLNLYTANSGNGNISFSSSFPGDIVPLEIAPNKEYIVQKKSFLASTGNINTSIYLQKRLRAGLFGGEGFIMQRLSGTGLAFAEVDGSATEIELQPGQQIVVSTGHVVLMEATCTMDIQTVKGAKNIFFGGEGIFNTVVTGPGKVILQSMPISKTAMALYPYMPISSN